MDKRCECEMPDEGGVCEVMEEELEAHYERIPAVVESIVSSYEGGYCFDHIGSEPISSYTSIVEMVERAKRILFPGYFSSTRLAASHAEYHIGREVSALFETLSRQITLAIRHDCLRYNQACTRCVGRGREGAITFMEAMPRIMRLLAGDVRAARDADPAAKSFDEIIFSYPGITAVTVFRMAHQLYLHDIPLLPRIMTEYAHGQTGIDIHPGANIGEQFFIDHGTGVVIGETTDIGDRVRIYQGVTLGAMSLQKDEVESLRGRKRHPTIEDDVIIYSGATILGGDTVIGARSVVGGSVWLTESIPPDTEVFLGKPELIFRKKR